ncbi:MAG TPA: hypothetical protein VMW77_08525 [Methanoregula sp.]|nr:hypothetical protein [Methanoregula sp.]
MLQVMGAQLETLRMAVATLETAVIRRLHLLLFNLFLNQMFIQPDFLPGMQSQRKFLMVFSFREKNTGE